MEKIAQLSGYSVDRRGFYKLGSVVHLFKKDPMSRPLYHLPGWFEQADLKKLIEEEFPEGLSLHGW